jgi:hypothetical protein
MLRTLIFTLFAAFATAGCFVSSDDDDDYYYAPAGTLVIDWTVAGSKARFVCQDFGADAIDIVVTTHDGLFVDEFTPSCERFEDALDLTPDRYTIDAVLLDVDGFEVTTAVRDSVRVYDLETTVSAIDFPEDSFL